MIPASPASVCMVLSVVIVLCCVVGLSFAKPLPYIVTMYRIIAESTAGLTIRRPFARFPEVFAGYNVGDAELCSRAAITAYADIGCNQRGIR